MVDSGTRLLWAERTESQLGPAQISQLEMTLGIRFIGLSRAQESIVGHRVLRSLEDGSTILRVRRNFDTPGFTFELVSSINDEDARNWEATHEQLRKELGRLESHVPSSSQSAVEHQEISLRAESEMTNVAAVELFLASSSLQLPTTTEGKRYTAQYILESMGEELAKEIGDIDQRLAALQVRLDAVQRPSTPNRRQRNSRKMFRNIEQYSRDEYLELLPAVGAFALLAATGSTLFTVLEGVISYQVAIFAAVGIAAVLGTLAVAFGRFCLRIIDSELQQVVFSGISLGVFAAFGFGSYLFYSIYTVGVPVPTTYALVTTLGLIAFAAIGYRNSKRRRQSEPEISGDSASVREMREEIEVLRVRRRTTLRVYTARAGAASTAARSQAGRNLAGDEDAQDRANEAWATPNWMAWAQNQLDREDREGSDSAR